jgi:hypothetical protein
MSETGLYCTEEVGEDLSEAGLVGVAAASKFRGSVEWTGLGASVSETGLYSDPGGEQSPVLKTPIDSEAWGSMVSTWPPCVEEASEDPI